MLKITNNRDHFYQWDIGQSLTVELGEGEELTEVHIGNDGCNKYYVVEPIDGIVAVYDELLQSDKNIIAYEYIKNDEDGHTIRKNRFAVFSRPKATDYAYTPTESYSWEYWVERAKMYAELSEESASNIPQLMASWWESHKEDFKGRDGDDGYSPVATVTPNPNGATITITDKTGTTTANVTNGQDGHTPIKGEDYFTPSEIAEITEPIESELNDVKESLNQKADKSEIPTDYVKKTDWATQSDFGVVRWSSTWGVNSYNGEPYVPPKTYENYMASNVSSFIGKGTLENVLAERLKEPQFELIEEITLTEDKTLIERFSEPNGTPVNWFGVLIKIKVPQQPVANANAQIRSHVRVKEGNSNVWSRPFTVGAGCVRANASTYFWGMYKNVNGIYIGQHMSPVTSEASSGALNTMYGLVEPNTNPINGLNIAPVNMETIPSGTNIKIYGIRA